MVTGFGGDPLSDGRRRTDRRQLHRALQLPGRRRRVRGRARLPAGSDGGTNQAIAGTGDGTTYSASTLAFPATVYRAPESGTPRTWLTAVSCATSTSCAAVGSYGATDGAIGPLAATWNGSSWTQIALRRGPVQLYSVSCPSRRWCMAVGGTIAERWAG